MSKRKKRQSAAPPASYLVAAVIAAIAGFATIYLSFAPPDNGVAPLDGGEAASGAGPGSASDSPLAGLNKGPMAAFLVRPKPLELADFSFEADGGGSKSLEDWRGKVVLLNLWATWCVPCREEMPALNALQREAGSDRFEVIAVNVDTGDDTKPKKFLAETGIDTLGYYRDNTLALFNDLKKRGLALGLPVTLLIDAEGCLLAHMNGPANWASEDARKLKDAAGG